jgi:hypothetical protein
VVSALAREDDGASVGEPKFLDPIRCRPTLPRVFANLDGVVLLVIAHGIEGADDLGLADGVCRG